MRSQAKAASLPKSENLKLITVPDIMAPGAYTDAVKGVTSIIRLINSLSPKMKYDESIWNPVTWEEALQGNTRTAYQASQKYAELAAHDH